MGLAAPPPLRLLKTVNSSGATPINHRAIFLRVSPVRMNSYRAGSFGYIRCACYLDSRCGYIIPAFFQDDGVFGDQPSISGFASATLVEVGLMPHNTVNRRRPPALAWVRALHAAADEFRGCGHPGRLLGHIRRVDK